MSNNNEISKYSNNELGFKNIKILSINKVNEYLFITLENGQKILTNGIELYDVSNYNFLFDIFNMGNRLCAVLKKGFSIYVVSLKNMEILFEDDKAYHIKKEDERTLNISVHINGENGTIYTNKIFDIETQKYLPTPDNYEFENSLGNNLYVFRDAQNSDTDFFEYKRTVINADGKTILKDIDGWVELWNNYLIVDKSKELCIVKINEDFSLETYILKQNEKIIAKPEYHNGQIIIIEKGLIKILTPDLNLINQFEIQGLESIVDYQIVSRTLKLCLPYTIDDQKINKHLFINLDTGKSISHIRIEGYPYWAPEVYVGKDDLNDEQKSAFIYDQTYDQTEYHFYDSEFNKVTDVKGNYYNEIDDNNIFSIGTWNGQEHQSKLLNIKNKKLKESTYDVVKFLSHNQYGLAYNTETAILDIIDKDLNIIISNIDCQYLGLSDETYFYDDLNYFVVNDYVCLIKHIAIGPSSIFRYIIQEYNGEIILDSTEHKCYPLGDLIQIIKNNESEFLNTITGEIGKLSIKAKTNEKGKIDLSKINNISNIIQVEGVMPLLQESTKQSPKSKKFTPNNKKDD